MHKFDPFGRAQVLGSMPRDEDVLKLEHRHVQHSPTVSVPFALEHGGVPTTGCMARMSIAHVLLCSLSNTARLVLFGSGTRSQDGPLPPAGQML